MPDGVTDGVLAFLDFSCTDTDFCYQIPYLYVQLNYISLFLIVCHTIFDYLKNALCCICFSASLCLNVLLEH